MLWSNDGKEEQQMFSHVYQETARQRHRKASYVFFLSRSGIFEWTSYVLFGQPHHHINMLDAFGWRRGGRTIIKIQQVIDHPLFPALPCLILLLLKSLLSL
jgi:hypothetical protein